MYDSITKKDLYRAFIRSWTLQHSLNSERMEGIGYLNVMLPILKKLYKGENFWKWVELHMEFFNTQPHMAALIMGMDIRAEEERSSEETVRMIKRSHMGPLAGIGDLVYWFVFAPITFSIGAYFAMRGDVFAPLISSIIWVPLSWYSKYWMLKKGYEEGMNFMEKYGNLLMRIRDLSVLFGMFMLGAATYELLPLRATPSSFVLREAIEYVEGYLPGIVNLSITLTMFLILKKGISMKKIVLMVFLASPLLSLLWT
ncbi:MAG: PTS system mannose/fructose/sorbose family transporter subunit IID [Candidatus Asgardarchaeia archaeon]